VNATLVASWLFHFPNYVVHAFKLLSHFLPNLLSIDFWASSSLLPQPIPKGDPHRSSRIAAMATEAASVYPSLEKRPIEGAICLFDVDGTLTPARRVSMLK